MKEIFRPRPKPAITEPVFYTITVLDIGVRNIPTEVGSIPVGDVIGAVTPMDIGKRLYRVHVSNPGRYAYVWQAENDSQFQERLASV